MEDFDAGSIRASESDLSSIKDGEDEIPVPNVIDMFQNDEISISRSRSQKRNKGSYHDKKILEAYKKKVMEHNKNEYVKEIINSKKKPEEKSKPSDLPFHPREPSVKSAKEKKKKHKKSQPKKEESVSESEEDSEGDSSRTHSTSRSTKTATTNNSKRRTEKSVDSKKPVEEVIVDKTARVEKSIPSAQKKRISSSKISAPIKDIVDNNTINETPRKQKKSEELQFSETATIHDPGATLTMKLFTEPHKRKEGVAFPAYAKPTYDHAAEIARKLRKEEQKKKEKVIEEEKREQNKLKLEDIEIAEQKKKEKELPSEMPPTSPVVKTEIIKAVSKTEVVQPPKIRNKINSNQGKDKDKATEDEIDLIRGGSKDENNGEEDDDYNDDVEYQKIQERNEKRLKRQCFRYIKNKQTEYGINPSEDFSKNSDLPLYEYQLEVVRISKEIEVRSWCDQKWAFFIMVNNLIKMSLTLFDEPHTAKYDAWVQSLHTNKDKYIRIYRRIYKLNQNQYKLNPKREFWQLYMDGLTTSFGTLLLQKVVGLLKGKKNHEDRFEDVTESENAKEIKAVKEEVKVSKNETIQAIGSIISQEVAKINKKIDATVAQKVASILSPVASSALNQVPIQKIPPELAAASKKITSKFRDEPKVDPTPAVVIPETKVEPTPAAIDVADDDDEIEVDVIDDEPKATQTTSSIAIPSASSIESKSTISLNNPPSTQSGGFNLYTDPKFASLTTLDPEQREHREEHKPVTKAISTVTKTFGEQWKSMTQMTSESSEKNKEEKVDMGEWSDEEEGNSDDEIDAETLDLQ